MANLTPADSHPGSLVHLLSAPEGSLLWARGMRKEIQACAGLLEIDREYVGDCLRLLLRTGGWRLLRDACGVSFRSFIQLCYSPRTKGGLGLSRADVEAALCD
jgi:hypothetical protein